MQSFELKRILRFYKEAKAKKYKTVMASLVGLKGSSYRKPGVRMLFDENGKMMGAISGGCVEKEIFRRAEEVFATGISKVVSYDGRYRLGCEGFLYVLIEKFEPTGAAVTLLEKALEKRDTIGITSYYKEATEFNGKFGSVFSYKNQNIALSQHLVFENVPEAWSCFRQKTKTAIQLILIGSGHDTLTLSNMASSMGWDVWVICSAQSNKGFQDFPGATRVEAIDPDLMDVRKIDERTAVVLMNHNFAKDLRYLLQLAKCPPKYTGILGSTKRWNRLQNELLEIDSTVDLDFLDTVYSPAGLDIGSETTEEISLAIASEIQAAFSNKNLEDMKALSVAKLKNIV
ncbi:XdhC family protein [Aquimarina sp. ERC-38]|uniref:XdhC family protein n=1 Tax=Aquimarina sp. ERC-38 TaxID=2949996 RepID=UPI0022482EEA|nr:XdhC/CoxI family protein [Aquimarina sp. ERC-38]UZO81036.1 XdhC family protein [Aquimarina sp. ERC-38]